MDFPHPNPYIPPHINNRYINRYPVLYYSCSRACCARRSTGLGGIKGKKVVTWRGAVKATTGLLPCPATSLTIPDIITQLLNGSHAPVQDHPARDSNPRFLMYMTNLIGFEPRNHLIIKVKIGTKKEIHKLATCLKSPDKASNYF